MLSTRSMAQPSPHFFEGQNATGGWHFDAAAKALPFLPLDGRIELLEPKEALAHEGRAGSRIQVCSFL
jgi:hypothetical protein